MKNIISKEPKVTELAIKAYELTGIKFNNVPIRGGTDGASLSYKGIPCPNLPTGGGNFHGVYEYLDINEFFMMREILFTLMDFIK
jgi:tripeptide aminopeptidase